MHLSVSSRESAENDLILETQDAVSWAIEHWKLKIGIVYEGSSYMYQAQTLSFLARLHINQIKMDTCM